MTFNPKYEAIDTNGIFFIGNVKSPHSSTKIKEYIPIPKYVLLLYNKLYLLATLNIAKRYI